MAVELAQHDKSTYLHYSVTGDVPLDQQRLTYSAHTVIIVREMQTESRIRDDSKLCHLIIISHSATLYAYPSFLLMVPLFAMAFTDAIQSSDCGRCSQNSE